MWARRGKSIPLLLTPVGWTGEAGVDLTVVCTVNLCNPHDVISIFHSGDISAEDFGRACDAMPVGHVDPVDKHS